MNARDCVRPYLPHRWSRVSGFCLNGCGNRDDGRILSRTGEVIAPGPTYSEAGLQTFRQRLENMKW